MYFNPWVIIFTKHYFFYLLSSLLWQEEVARVEQNISNVGVGGMLTVIIDGILKYLPLQIKYIVHVCVVPALYSIISNLDISTYFKKCNNIFWKIQLKLGPVIFIYICSEHSFDIIKPSGNPKFPVLISHYHGTT